MWNLRLIHNDWIFYFTTISDDTIISDNNISSNICSFSDLTILTNYAWAFYHGSMLYDSISTNTNVFIFNIDITNNFRLIFKFIFAKKILQINLYFRQYFPRFLNGLKNRSMLKPWILKVKIVLDGKNIFIEFIFYLFLLVH